MRLLQNLHGHRRAASSLRGANASRPLAAEVLQEALMRSSKSCNSYGVFRRLDVKTLFRRCLSMVFSLETSSSRYSSSGTIHRIGGTPLVRTRKSDRLLERCEGGSRLGEHQVRTGQRDDGPSGLRADQSALRGAGSDGHCRRDSQLFGPDVVAPKGGFPPHHPPAVKGVAIGRAVCRGVRGTGSFPHNRL